MANVNNKETIIKIPKPSYYHCFKLNEGNYALFDIKMDMPLIIGSIAIIKSTKLPLNSTVFYYKLESDGFFKKAAEKYMEIGGDGKRIKKPLKYKILDNKKVFYHHFKLTPILSVLFDDEFEMPVMYGSNQKIQSVINKLSNEAMIFYYKEDTSVKNSFKLWMVYKGKK